MSLLLLLRSRRTRSNAGHAEIPAIESVGRGRVIIPARIAAGYLPRPRPVVVIRGTGAAELPALDAFGVGRLTGFDGDEAFDRLVALLLSAA